jgi:hypothetical protein
MADDTNSYLNNKNQIRSDLGDISRSSGMGDMYAAMQDSFYGINHRGTGNPLQHSAEQYGLTFFTRPMLNLTYHNALADRRLHPYLTEDRTSIKRAIRAILDPRGNRGEFSAIKMDIQPGDKDVGDAPQVLDSPLVDPRSPFICLLTNNLLSLSGWPDVTVETYTSTPGMMNESWGMVDGPSRNYSSYDLTANFKNVAGDPITLFFNAWITYMTQVYAGVMVPYPDMILYNEIDYMTRIYRITFDPTRTYVQKIFATGGAFPTANPLGAAANFNSERPISEENAQISVPFKCFGAEYNDPVTIMEFNRLVQIYDPLMITPIDVMDNIVANIELNDVTPVGVLQGLYAKIPPELKKQFNYRGKPRINPLTMEFELFLPVSDFPPEYQAKLKRGA